MSPDPARLGFVPHTRHNTVATSIAMRFWARSIGDRNPRHVVETEAGQGGPAAFVAHPCWLYSVHDTVVNVGAAGGHPLIAGTRWRFGRPVVEGDVIHTSVRLVAERAVTSRHAGPALLQEVAVTYSDARGAALATATSTLLRVDREQARASTKHADWKRWRYTEEQLMAIEAAADAEVVRGADAQQAGAAGPLYRDDVTVGTVLPRIVRGPLSSEEMVLFVGGTRPIPGGAGFVRALAAGTTAAFLHPRTGTYESYSAGLVDDEAARQLGFPAAHDYGIDRISQAASLVCNWIGATGRLLSLDARLTAPHLFGDTSWFDGRVVACTDDGTARIDLVTTNQRGATTLTGSALVWLPSRVATAGDDAAVLAVLGGTQ